MFLPCINPHPKVDPSIYAKKFLCALISADLSSVAAPSKLKDLGKLATKLGSVSRSL